MISNSGTQINMQEIMNYLKTLPQNPLNFSINFRFSNSNIFNCKISGTYKRN